MPAINTRMCTLYHTTIVSATVIVDEFGSKKTVIKGTEHTISKAISKHTLTQNDNTVISGNENC